ncbi:hypothetical protein [Erythrobacter sp. EC-HK427]|uniref:hypothetical protein n=1 Tax=Erythrobacter sp. EC-HK427 TaxID=2038396 RepID=UPI00125F6295|nr:hypothetical protein [Erythrobacter sp. EC-HK427]
MATIVQNAMLPRITAIVTEIRKIGSKRADIVRTTIDPMAENTIGRCTILSFIKKAKAKAGNINGIENISP